MHPLGFTDTVVIGCDSLGDTGFQVGLDVLDSLFEVPTSIRSFDNAIALEGSCTNLKEDFRGFVDGFVTFPLYLKSTEIAVSVGNEWVIKWDNSDFNYRNEDYYLQEVLLESRNGFLSGIDGTFEGIVGYSPATDTVKFLSIPEITLIGFQGLDECDDSDNYIIQVDVRVGFNVFPVGLNEIKDLSAKLYPNPFTEYLNIDFPKVSSYTFEVYDLAGRSVFLEMLQDISTTRLSLMHLDIGNYIVVISDTVSGARNSYILQKTS